MRESYRLIRTIKKHPERFTALDLYGIFGASLDKDRELREQIKEVAGIMIQNVNMTELELLCLANLFVIYDDDSGKEFLLSLVRHPKANTALFNAVLDTYSMQSFHSEEMYDTILVHGNANDDVKRLIGEKRKWFKIYQEIKAANTDEKLLEIINKYNSQLIDWHLRLIVEKKSLDVHFRTIFDIISGHESSNDDIRNLIVMKENDIVQLTIQQANTSDNLLELINVYGDIIMNKQYLFSIARHRSANELVFDRLLSDERIEEKDFVGLFKFILDNPNIDAQYKKKVKIKPKVIARRSLLNTKKIKKSACITIL